MFLISMWFAIGALVPMSWTWYIIISIAVLVVGFFLWRRFSSNTISETPEVVEISGGLLTLLLIIVLLGRACGGGDDNDEMDSCGRGYMLAEAQNQVENRLTYSEEASFEIFGTTAEYDDASKTWMVIGDVVSKNGFGVNVRLHYSVHLKCNEGTGNITTINVTINPR